MPLEGCLRAQAHPRELRDDVIAVARRREGAVTLSQVAKDFGISESCLINWLRSDDVEASASLALPTPSRPWMNSSATHCVSAWQHTVR